MAVVTTWSVTLVRNGETLDMTGHVTGVGITQQIKVGEMGTGSASVTVTNHDGEFTPGEGGTFDVDLFGYALIIEATITSGRYGARTAEVFHGVVSGFSLDDDGVTSTAIIYADDAISIAGRAVVDADIDIPNTTQIFLGLNAAAEALLNGYTYGGTEYLAPVPFPSFGGTTDTEANGYDTTPVASRTGVVIADLADVVVSDVLNLSMLPTGPGLAYPTTIDVDASPVVNFYTVDRFLVKDTGSGLNDRREYIFDEDRASVFSLPFRQLRRGYTTDQVTNSAQITRTDPAAVTQTATAPTSVATYGSRNVQYSGTLGTSDTSTLRTAELWANRTSVATFAPSSLTVSGAMVREICADEYAATTWEDLLDMRTGQWNPAEIIYTPTGGTQRTDLVMLAGRRVSITPTDVTVTVDVLPLADNSSFELDSDTLGRLDTNRLG